MARALGIGMALLQLALAGCGGEAKLAPVEGRVLFRGQPLRGGTIVFTPDPDRGNSGPLATAEIGADGRFVLTSGGKPGAVPGWHRVTVAPPALPPTAAIGELRPLPRRYSHGAIGAVS